MTSLNPKIGLEIHVELKTQSKLFCDCPNNPEEIHPNTNICEVCTGQPGVLPVVNKQAVIDILSLAKAFRMKINNPSIFARKHYFYPDLPKNYQISQYELPVAFEGEFEIFREELQKRIRIHRIHLEEDAGRLLHFDDYSLVDFNRAGVPLIEIVTEPDFRTARESSLFAEELIILLRTLDISNANPEKGEIRFEANISLGPREELGTKVEVKNLNSIRALEEAIKFEIERQKQILLSGEKVIQETRGWDEIQKRTFSQRTKEEAEDYRYFPEPDLPPLLITEDLEEAIVEIELIAERKKRMMQEYQLAFSEVQTLIKEKVLADFFEEAVSELANLHSQNINLLKNYFLNDLLGLLKEENKSLSDLNLSPKDFAELIYLLEEKVISSKIVKDILLEVVRKNTPVKKLIQKKKKISDPEKIKEIVKKIILENEKAVQDYRNGKETAFEFLIGTIMRETKGQADPDLTRAILQEELKK